MAAIANAPVAGTMKLDADDYRVRAGAKVRLAKRPTRTRPYYESKTEYERKLADLVGQMRRFQEVLYADNRFALLIIFQAMDAAGKDGAIKHVMSGVNPQGCQVFSFKHPSAEELEHDFLWRTYRAMPERGRIGIFNRSYYEEVLIVRVHPEILQAQNLPEPPSKGDEIWTDRFRSIVDMESHLHRNGTRIIKFFLHVSKDEQRKRFLARLDDPEKNWKFNEGDVAERGFWDDYMHAYEECLSGTSRKHAPWYVIPADDKPNARLIISQVIVQTMKGLNLSYPKLGKNRASELQKFRKILLK